jgi:2',3'-cyclic-nucleotide 2'-phosphodiesterase/3'-nucleotidase
MPFDNYISIVTMTKAEVKTVLEQAFMDGGKGIQIAGFKVKFDPARPSMKRVVEITREDGTKISEGEVLKVATNDFMATGGDGFTGFLDANKKDRSLNTHILVRDVLLADVRANGKITATMNKRIENVSSYIQVVATSDLHGNIYPLDYFANKPSDLGLAKVSTYVKGLKAKNANVMLIDNGDTIQGTPLVTYYNSIDTKAVYPMMKVMGAMGYDAWTLGNHEFNFGLPTLDRIVKDAKDNKINVLSANVVKTSGGTYVEPYFIKEFNVNGKTVKVGILGLTTKNVPGWEDPAHYAGLKFNDLVDEAKHWVPIMKEKGADVVIVSAHSGEEGAADLTEENQIKAIATKVSGIDAIVAGHVHNVVADLTLKNPEGKVVPVVEPGKYAQNVSLIRIPVSADGNVGSAEISNVKMDATITADQAILDLAKPYQDATLEYVKTKIGVSTAEYTGAGQTMKPTAIMELINKVQMQGAKTQLSIAAPLSASARIPSGDISIQDIMSVYVYENFLYGVKMNAKQIKDWMELSVKYYKQVKNATDPIEKDPVLNIADYNLDQLYGMSYDIDLTQPVGQRIKNMKYNGKLVKDTDVFTVAINNYRYNGGGGFMKAAGLSSTDANIVTYDSAKALGDDGQVRSMMIKYIQDNKTITPSVENNWKVYTTTVKQEGQQVVPTQPTTKVVEYIVKPGDVLWRIAQKYGVTYKQVGEYNKLKNFNLIHVGQKLLIPAN